MTSCALSKGFDQEIFSFNISASWVLTIALIVIEGIILLNEIPNLIRNIIAYYQLEYEAHDIAHSTLNYIWLSSIKIMLAFLIIGERKRIVGFL